MAETAVRASIGGKFLTFFLAGEEYGIEILKVREIIGLMPITRVPNAPPTVCGIINLRGKVIPVMELRLSFGLDTIEATEQTCIIVVQAGGTEFGIVVDRVSEVANVADQDIEDAPSFGEGANTEYLLGIAKAGGRVKLLLDIDRVLSSSELRHARAAAAA
jgi:purine-binding chemotaxis protein CheW